MAVNLSPVGGVAGQFFDNNGNPLTGGKIYTYSAGTSTNLATYTSTAGVTAHTNPIILDAGGRVPGGEIWLTDGLQYKFVLKNSVDTLIGTYDNIIGINSNFINFLAQEEIQTATAGQTVFTLATVNYQPGTNSLSVFVDGVNQYDGSSYSYVETDGTTVTFTAGLHVGALVKFTTAQSLSSGATDASIVTYTPAGTGAVSTTVQAKLRESVSVLDFGAVGDGSTDDTVAILAMFTEYTGTSVEFDGLGLTFKLTSTISKTLSSNVHWRLKDFNFTSTSIAEPGGETGVLNFTGDEIITGPSVLWTGTNSIDVVNCSFTDSRVALGTLDGLILNNFNRVWLTGVIAKGYSNTGVLVEQSNNVWISNCEMSHNMYAGLRQGSNQTVVITGGNYSYNGINAPTYGYGLASSAGDAVNITSYVTVQGVTANFNLRKGIDFHAGIDVSIMGCTVIGYGESGIYAIAEPGGKTTYNVSIIGNYVYGYDNALGNSAGIEIGSYGTAAPESGDFIVSNNRIQSSQVSGSSAVLVTFASTGFAPRSVNINNNTIRFGSSSNAPIINFNPNSTYADRVKVNDNILHSIATTYAIKAYNISNQIKIDGNEICIDSGTVTQGIYIRDDAAVQVSIDNNQFFGSATYGSGTGIFEDYISQIASSGPSARNNRLATSSLKDVYPTGISQAFGTAAPVSASTFNRQGSQVIQSTAAVGSPKGWRCTVTGSPGTWVSEGVL